MASDTHIACIGSRRIEKASDRYLLEHMGAKYAEDGYTITSGNADGADDLFAAGASDVAPERVEIYLPWDSYNRRRLVHGNQIWTADQATQEHWRLAQDAHHRWDWLKDSVRRLMVRNAMLIRRFDKPVDLVVAFPDMTKPGLGGTGHACRCALMLRIPIWLAGESRYLDTRRDML